MKTDNVKLFEFSVLEFQNNGSMLEEFSVDFVKRSIQKM